MNTLKEFLEGFNKKLPEGFEISVFAPMEVIQVLLKADEKPPVVVFLAQTPGEVKEWLLLQETIVEEFAVSLWLELRNRSLLK